MIHSEFLFFYLIKLYTLIMDEEFVSLEKLEKAFYILQAHINQDLDVELNYDFEKELEKLEDKYDDLFVFKDNYIGFTDIDIDTIEEEIIDNYKVEELVLDDNIPIYVQNIRIYKSLGIVPSPKEYLSLLDTNISIIQNYLNLAYQELLDSSCQKQLFTLLKNLNNYLDEQLQNLEEKDILKLTCLITYYNDLYLADEETNVDWYIILFSKDPSCQKTLYYQKLWRYIDEYYENPEIDDDLDDIPYEEIACLCDETDYFISYFTILLNNYIKTLDLNKTKTILMTKRNLLIAINPDMEIDYLSTHTLDDIILPKIVKEELTDSSFLSMYLIAAELINNVIVTDKEITNTRYADMITSTLFIKTFLILCPNESICNDIKDRICTNHFYKKDEYSIATHLIDDIIFKEKGLELNRNINN